MTATADAEAIVIVGAGGHGREQLELIHAVNAVRTRYRVEGFVVDPEHGSQGDVVAGRPVLGGVDWVASHRDEATVVCAIGASSARARMLERLRAAGARFATLVHPAATVSTSAVIGEGAIVCAGSVLTSDVRIGAHVHCGVGSIVSHDCVVDDLVSLAPGCRLAGAVHLEAGAQLGVGTVVRDHVTVGAWSITGAGTVVVEDVPPNATAIGVPARVVETRAPGWQGAPSVEPGRPAGSGRMRSGA